MSPLELWGIQATQMFTAALEGRGERLRLPCHRAGLGCPPSPPSRNMSLERERVQKTMALCMVGVSGQLWGTSWVRSRDRPALARTSSIQLVKGSCSLTALRLDGSRLQP